MNIIISMHISLFIIMKSMKVEALLEFPMRKHYDCQVNKEYGVDESV